MAISIQAPVAQQLFALGSTSSGNDKFNYQGKKPGGFRQGQLMQAPVVKNESSGGQAKALASVGGALAGAASNYLNTPSSTPDSQGNGFGLGANLVSGEAGSAKYAGDEKPGLMDLVFKKEDDQMPVDNGTTPQENPYALNYGNARQRSSLFTYGGSYGGATY